MRLLVTTAALLALVPALAGCGDKAPSDVEEGDVTGDVLPGSASDAMIPLGQLRSEAPADPQGTSVPGDDSDSEENGSGDTETVEMAPAPPPLAPASTSAPAPAPSATRQPVSAPSSSPPKAAPPKTTPKAPPKTPSADAPPLPVSVLPTKTPN